MRLSGLYNSLLGLQQGVLPGYDQGLGPWGVGLRVRELLTLNPKTLNPKP